MAIQMSNTVVILLVILVAAFLFVAAGCSLKCSNPQKEGYIRSCLSNDCTFQRTPVDFAKKHPDGWQRNPHYKANPSVKWQPLDYGPVDFTPDARRLNEKNGVLFQQYRNDWKGCGQDQVYLLNDEKTRFDLTNVGDQGVRVYLDNLQHPRHGLGEPAKTELDLVRPDPGERIYGGDDYLPQNEIGQ